MKKKKIVIIEWLNDNLSEISSFLSILINAIFLKPISKLNFFKLVDSQFQALSTALLIIILSPCIKKLKKYIYQKTTRINIIFMSSLTKKQSIEDECYISFDDEYKLSKLYMNVEVIGDPQLLLQSKITINFPRDFTVNHHEDNGLYEISPNKSGIILEAKVFFNNEKTEKIQENKTIGIYLYKEGKDTNSSTELRLNKDEVYLENNKIIM